jgi:hypothetical protein
MRSVLTECEVQDATQMFPGWVEFGRVVVLFRDTPTTKTELLLELAALCVRWAERLER